MNMKIFFSLFKHMSKFKLDIEKTRYLKIDDTQFRLELLQLVIYIFFIGYLTSIFTTN